MYGLTTGTSIPYCTIQNRSSGSISDTWSVSQGPTYSFLPRSSPHVFRCTEQVGGASAAGCRPVRRHPRRLDRQRRVAVDRRRPQLLPGEPVLGRQRLRARVRRLPAARRADGRPARSTPAVHDRARRIRARLAGRRARADRGPAHHRPRRAGPRRRAVVTRRALARDRVVRGGRGAQQGDGCLGRGGRLWRRRRRAARRHADRVGRLGVGAVRQRAGRPVRRRAGDPPAARVAHRGAPSLRLRGRRVDHRRPVAAGLHAGRRRERRLGLDPDARAGRDLAGADRGLLLHRAALQGSADAVPRDLPDPHDHRHQRVGGADRGGAVLDVLLHLALHAAGARLLGARGWAWPTCRWRWGSSSRQARRPGW